MGGGIGGGGGGILPLGTSRRSLVNILPPAVLNCTADWLGLRTDLDPLVRRAFPLTVQPVGVAVPTDPSWRVCLNDALTILSYDYSS
jgi:hypothetical protein